MPEQAHNLSLADGMHGFILQVAVHAFSFGAREGLGVLSLLVGSVGRVHRVAESAAEFGGAGPVNHGRTGAYECHTDDSADQHEAGTIPFAVLIESHQKILLIGLFLLFAAGGFL